MGHNMPAQTQGEQVLGTSLRFDNSDCGFLTAFAQIWKFYIATVSQHFYKDVILTTHYLKALWYF